MNCSKQTGKMYILPGWYSLYDEFYDCVEEWNSKNPTNIVKVNGAKQRWGDLRIRFFPDIPKLVKKYDEIIKKSNVTCEICGSTDAKYVDMYDDENYIDHWMYVLCKQHSYQHPNIVLGK